MNLYDFIKTDILISMKYFTALIALIALTSFSSQSIAQNDDISAKMADPDSTIIEKENIDEEYATGSVQNFSKLYWKLGALGIDNTRAVDNFLRINECDIYKSFYKDDFQWRDVRKSAEKMLLREKGNFPNKFRFMIPIDLGRYDMARKGFPLVSETGFRNLRRIHMGGNSPSEIICGAKGNIPFYPRNIILVLNKPLTLDFLSLDEHVAQAFIVRRKYSASTLSAKDKQLHYGRLAFLQIRATISHFQGIQNTGSSSKNQAAVVYGKIDAIDVYEDRNRKSLLKNISFERKKYIPNEKELETIGEEEMTTPPTVAIPSTEETTE